MKLPRMKIYCHLLSKKSVVTEKEINPILQNQRKGNNQMSIDFYISVTNYCVVVFFDGMAYGFLSKDMVYCSHERVQYIYRNIRDMSHLPFYQAVVFSEAQAKDLNSLAKRQNMTRQGRHQQLQLQTKSLFLRHQNQEKRLTTSGRYCTYICLYIIDRNVPKRSHLYKIVSLD